MSVYYNQTNLTPGTSQYITRNEVIDALSTIANDLSGVNFSNLFANPNPSFSTITMNAAGSILGGSVVGASSALQVSSVLETYNRMFPNNTDPYILGFRDNISGTDYTPLALGQVWVKPHTYTTEPTCIVAPQVFSYGTSLQNAGQYPVISLNTLTNSVALSNISSMNGVNPTTAGTTFTTLTGSNLTTTGTLTSPQFVSLSSINAVPFQLASSSNYITSNVITVPTLTPTSAITAAVPAGVLAINRSYLFNIPFVLGSNFPPAPLNFQLTIGVRLGGNGQINYCSTYWIASNSVFPITLDLTGIAQTNITTLAANTIEVIVIQNSGSVWSDAFYSPPNGANLNTWTLKLIS